METAKYGDKVQVHYSGRLEETGMGFDSSEDREPLEFTIGGGKIIAGFERAVIGMAPGESKTVKIPTAEAYGSRQNELVFEVSRTKLPEGFEPQAGQVLSLVNDGRTTPVVVLEVSDSSVLLDANHPLAGKDLIFTIRLVAIAQAA